MLMGRAFSPSDYLPWRSKPWALPQGWYGGRAVGARGAGGFGVGRSCAFEILCAGVAVLPILTTKGTEYTKRVAKVSRALFEEDTNRGT